MTALYRLDRIDIYSYICGDRKLCKPAQSARAYILNYTASMEEFGS